ncbi:MAG: hypothetical protein KF767_10495 [Bdellovibrionaceae bacterium]|nr:hypothetical protein [Pseudobdellovibrionaceae bacterium]
MSVIQFSFWKYALKPKTRIGSVATVAEREGALLRIKWPDELTGYGDLFPWPEFGDADVTTQLFNLKSGRLSTGLEQTIHLARKDAQARAFNQNLMRGLPRVRNHFLIADPDAITEAELTEAKKLGFQSVKLKCGSQIDKELELAVRLVKQKGFLLRLDFNGKATPADIEKFKHEFPEGLRSKIEFIEDPFPFVHELWQEASELAPLAVDQEYVRVPWADYSESKPPPFKVIVLKPARQDMVKAREFAHRFRLKIVVTSSLDHPVGIMHAAAACGDMKRLYPNMVLDSGCFSHTAYEPDRFSQMMSPKGPFLAEVAGSGVGFDQILKELPWTDLRSL